MLYIYIHGTYNDGVREAHDKWNITLIVPSNRILFLE